MIHTGVIATRVTAAAGFPLDSYTVNLAGAYSPRQLTTAITGPFYRARRDNDNAEADITTDADLASHVGANSGFIVAYYDQSGNGRTATIASVPNNQLRCRNAGTNDTLNGHVTGYSLDTTDGGYSTATFTTYTGTTLTVIAVFRWGGGPTGTARVLSVVDNANIDYDGTVRAACILRNGSGNSYGAYRNNAPLNSLAVSNGTAYSVATRFDGTNCNFRQGSNTAAVASSGSFGFNRIILAGSAFNSGQAETTSEHCEWIVWASDINDTVTQAVQSEQRTYWGAS